MKECKCKGNCKNKYPISKIDVLDNGFVRLVDSFGDDNTIVQTARVSYGKGTKSKSDDESLIRYLVRNKHTSPLEHVKFRFHTKLPIFVARQIVRHRTTSINEVSARYSELPEEFYVPETQNLTLQSTDNKQGRGTPLNDSEALSIKQDMISNAKSSFELYHNLLNKNVAREIARINLPLSTYTEWYWCIDLHNLFHFLNLRLHPHAQWETRQFAEAKFKLIKQIVPVACNAFEDYILNARTFSAQEMDIIRKNIQIPDNISLPKRELKEFFDKIK